MSDSITWPHHLFATIAKQSARFRRAKQVVGWIWIDLQGCPALRYFDQEKADERIRFS